MRPARFIFALLATAIAVTALTSAARATELCSKEVAECEAKSVLGEGTAVTASLKSETKSKFVTSLGTVECSKASIEATTGATEEVPLPIKVSEMSFGTCTLGKTSCTVSAVNLPYYVALFAGKAVAEPPTSKKKKKKVNRDSRSNAARPSTAPSLSRSWT